MKKDDCYNVGRIVRTHGFKGDLSIKLDVDNPDEYIELESVFVEINGKLIPFFMTLFELRQKGQARVHFEGIDDEQAAQSLLKKQLYLPLEFLPPLDGTDFYYHEMPGFQAYDTEHGLIGTITSILEGGAQDLFSIDANGKEVLLPIVDELILELDREKKTILINAPEGLIDFYLS